MSEKKKTLVKCAQEIMDVYDEDIHQIIPISAITGLDSYFEREDVVDERELLNLGDDSETGIIFIGITDKDTETMTSPSAGLPDRAKACLYLSKEQH